MKMFAIRHRPTGLYLPRVTSRGSTHREPTAQLKNARLFHRERDAKGFLTTWLQGKLSQRSCPSSFDFDDDVETVLEPVPSRKREEMEIVAFELQEV